MTLLAVTHLTVLGVGYFAGRRAYRRKLQTTEGRRRAGRIEPIVWRTEPATIEIPRINLRRISTEPMRQAR